MDFLYKQSFEMVIDVFFNHRTLHISFLLPQRVYLVNPVLHTSGYVKKSHVGISFLQPFTTGHLFPYQFLLFVELFYRFPQSKETDVLPPH